MTDEIDSAVEELLSKLLSPLARLMIDTGVTLTEATEMLKAALVEAVFAQDADATLSHASLLTGVHRKDIKRLKNKEAAAVRSTAASRLLSIWQNAPEFQEDGHPKPLMRSGNDGFDALVRRAKVDAAPATMLSVLRASGNIQEKDGRIAFVTASFVPAGQDEKLRAAIATLYPHMETTVGNVLGERSQWDQVLRYSHLSDAAAKSLEAEAARLALDMLKALNRRALQLQQAEEGATLFVAGTFTHIKEHDV